MTSAFPRSSGARAAMAARVLLPLLVLLPASGASAHAVGFGAWRLEELPGGRWRSTLRVDGAEGAPIALTVEGCTVERMRREVEPPRVRLVGVLSCSAGPGPRFAIEGLPEHMRVRAVLVPRIGPERSFVVRAEDPEYRVEAAQDVGARYLELGVVHILLGWDHVAFVLALLLLLRLDRRGWRRILGTLSAFTVGHSLTLALAALGILRVDASLTEAMIAASLVLLAVELARADGARGLALSWTRRAPEGVALFFGLFHGLGFAGVLQELGLPPSETLLALLAFNGGVELGQIAVAAVALGLTRALGPRIGSAASWRWAAGYALGCAGVFVTLERLFGA